MRAQATGARSPAAAPTALSVPAPAGLMRRKCGCGGAAGLDGECAECGKKRLARHRAAPGRPEAEQVPPLVYGVLRAPGKPLDTATRGLMEARFGHDFGQIRVHVDAPAAQSARAVNAHAYALSNHIVFDTGRYAPTTRGGAWLLAHELAHTIQQGDTGPQAKLALAQASDAAEAAADRTADAVIAGRPVPAPGSSGPGLHRYRITSVDRLGRDERLVHLDNGIRYRVRRVRWLATRTERVGFGRVTPGIDRQRLWLEVEWCAGQNHGTVRVGANVPERVLQTILNAATSGGDIEGAIRDLDITPFIETNILQSGAFRITGRGEITVNMQGQVTGGRGRVGISSGPVDVDIGVGPTTVEGRSGVEVRGTVTVTPGRRTETEDCRRERRRIVENTRFECTSERDIPPREVPETVKVEDRQTRYVYFEYARDALHARSAATIADLRADLGAGFQVSGIRGFTSPEGPMAPGRGGFIGNEELARRRAAAAARVVEESCRSAGLASLDSCFVGGAGDVSPTGEGELYTIAPLDAAGVPQEVEGAPLAEHAAAEFLTGPAEQPHRTPELTEQVAAPGTTSQQKADLVYPLLRRAEITLVRTRSEPRTRRVEGRTETTPATCPDDVVDSAFPRVEEAL